VLAVCTDITRIIDLERQGQVLRSQFFSSIAHELRTPLNSILPILKLILESLRRKPSDLSRVMQLLQVVMNSTTHLQNVINDALDITRIENNRFEVFPSLFNIREVLNEVCEVMRFQID
jgi:signal transduction histidine kinase